MQKTNLVIPLAIIIAGAMLAGAVYFRKDNDSRAAAAPAAAKESDTIDGVGNIKIKEVTSVDYIRGNPNAAVKVIVFSDTECPFCKRFHDTMNQIMDEYGRGSQVAWVYRHFPLEAIHSKARKEAEALECAGDLGGNTGFWNYADKLFEITPSNDGLDMKELPNVAVSVGLDLNKFNECLGSGKFVKNVTEDLDDGAGAGARGTPYSIVIAANGKKFTINGALPYESVKATIEQALAEK